MPIQTFKTGNLNLPSNLFQGPLAGYSCAPFRELIWQFGGVGFCTTEMISCKTLLYNRMSRKRFTYRAPQEGPLCYQLSSNNPQELGEVTKMVADMGADLIDLNCGCPVQKIRKKGAGSKLLSAPNELSALINAMRNSTSLPISIKIRVDASSSDKNNHEIVKVVNDSGLDFLTVHGRHWSERYDVDCRYDDIQFFVDHVNIPVVGNGDIRCVDTLNKMLATGCAGVMVARSGMGRPWLFKQLTEETNGDNFEKPAAIEIAQLLIQHVETLTKLIDSEKFALLQARGFLKYYLREMDALDVLSEARECESIAELSHLILNRCR